MKTMKKLMSKEEQAVIRELRGKQRKIFHSCYTILDRKTAAMLGGKGAAAAYLCGVYTDVCIAKVAMDAFDSGMDVRVVSDACSSLHGKNSHRFAIDSLGHIIGKQNIISTKDAVSWT